MSYATLFRTRRFYPLFWTQFLGAFNDNLLKNAWVVFLTFRAKSLFGLSANQMASVAAGVFILPYFLFSAIAGQMADKYEKSRFIAWIKLAEIVIMILAFLGFVYDRYDYLLFLLFLMGVHSTFFGPVKYSILPQHLHDDELVAANAQIELGTFLAILLGTIVGGVLVLRQHGPIYVGTILSLVSALGWWMSLKIPKADAVEPSLQLVWTLFKPLKQVYQLTRKRQSVFLSILGISWFWFFGGAVLSMLPAYAKDFLYADESVVTLFLAVFSIGIGIGSILCDRFSKGEIELGMIPIGSFGVSAFIVHLFFIGSPIWIQVVYPTRIDALSLLREPVGLRIILDLAMVSIFSGLFIVPLYALIQKRSDPNCRSRIIAGNNIMNAVFMVISSFIIVFLMGFKISIPKVFLILGLANLFVSYCIFRVIPDFMLRFIVWMISIFMYRVKIVDKANLPKEGPLVLVCNHVSYIDWMIIAASVRRPVRFVMYHTFQKNIFLRCIINPGRIILIAPRSENPTIFKQAFEKISAELKSNAVVCIFPEGSLTYTGELAPFKTGIEHVIAEDPVPVVPMALSGLWGSVFSRAKDRSKRVSRGVLRPIELRIGKPIPPEQVSASGLYETVNALLDSRP
jgi:hypothetical protein